MNFGGGNMQQLMRQAQAMQKQMEAKQAELESTEFTGTSSGMVTVVVNGAKQLKSIKIDKNAVDPDDVEMLEDLIKAAFNDVMKKVDEAQAAITPKLPF